MRRSLTIWWYAVTDQQIVLPTRSTMRPDAVVWRSVCGYRCPEHPLQLDPEPGVLRDPPHARQLPGIFARRQQFGSNDR